MGEDIDWQEITAKLPSGRSDEEKEIRKELFDNFDPNGNGIISLAEVDRGIRDVLGIDEIFNAKPAIMRAFQIAKDATESRRSDGVGDDYIEFREFRFFLLSLRQYFEYWVSFKTISSDEDRRIDLDEFMEARSKIMSWVGPIEDMEEEFANIDTNGGGYILFDEFVRWAITKNLDIEEDDD